MDAVGYCCHGNCCRVIGWQVCVLISYMARDQFYVIATGLTSFLSHTHLDVSQRPWNIFENLEHAVEEPLGNTG